MSSNVQSALELLKFNDYISVVIITAIAYDYLLTFRREIDYVWCKPWSWVSTMFILARYVGLCWAVSNGLVGSTFVPGPMMTCTALYLVIYWGFPIFLLVADLVMILRVYAMWGRSKWILYVLLFVCVPQVIISFILAGIYYNPNTYLSVTVVRVGEFSFCSGPREIPSSLLLGITIPRLVLAVTLLILAAIPTLKESVEMYKATRIWQPNQYMQQLMRDGVLYFFVYVSLSFAFIILAVSFSVAYANHNGPVIDASSTLILSAFSYIAICPVMPRFIINVRELYERDLRGRWQGIDTGFGILSQPARGNVAVPPVVFSDVTLQRRFDPSYWWIIHVGFERVFLGRALAYVYLVFLSCTGASKNAQFRERQDSLSHR